MSWRTLVALSLLVVLAAAYSAVPAAQDQQSTDLFTAAPASVADSLAAALARPDTTAARVVAVNPAAFDAQRLQIALFGGASLVAERRLVDARTSDARVWNGTIPGSPLSSVTLAEVEGIVQGSIRTLDAAYSIEPLASDGTYALRQVDTSRPRPELPPARVPPLDAAADLSTPQADNGSRFDVLVIYNEAARSASGSDANVRARISLGIAEANTAFANSQVVPRLRLVGAEFVDYTQDPNIAVDLARIRSTADGFLDAVHARRDALGADLVQLVVGPQTNACGIGYVMDALSPAFDAWAFSVTAYDCISPNLTFAHELGHNMGSNHAPEDLVPGDTALYPYSFGYKHPARLFRTVMAYDCAAGGCPRVLHFSNPNVLRGSQPTGTAAGNDNARSINNARLTVANWRAAADVTPPTISAIAAQGTNEDAPTAPIPFTIGDPDTAIANLVVSASSSNVALVPNTPAALTLAGTDADRTLVVTPAANQFGTATITVSVTDGNTVVSTSFVLTVAAVNDAPTIAFNPASASLPQGVPAESIVTVSDIDSPGLNLFLSATSSNQSLLTNANIAITPLSSTASSRTFRATMAPSAGEHGSTTVSFVANDFGAGGTTVGLFPLTVRARPTVSAIDAQTMLEDASLTVPFTVGDPDTPVGSLTVSVSSSDPALVDADGLDLGGSGPSRSLTITPNDNAHGSATITVAVGDGAQTVQRAFALTVTPVNDAPAFHALTATSVTLASGAPTTFYVTLTDPDSTPETITLSGVASNTTLLPSVAITPGATTAAGRQFAVTLTSVAGGTGSTSLGLTASDPQSGTSARNIAAVVVAAPVAPDSPLNLSAVASGARVTLEWFAARTGAPATSYSVEIGTAAGTTTLPTQTTTAPVTTFSADLPDGLYFVRVRGVNGAGSSVPSSEAVVAVGAAALLPGPPANFTIRTFRTSATLSWTPSTVGQPAASYVIEAGSAPGLANLARLVTTGPATSFVVPFVPQGTYFVRVRGRNQIGTGAPSQNVSIVMGPRGQCLGLAHAPVLLTPVVNGNNVTLSWNAASTGGPAESYVIGAGSAPGLLNLALFDTGSSGTSFAASAPSGVYYVRVAANNPCGLGPASNEVSFTLGPQLPGEPSGLQASVSQDRRVSLTWTPPASGGVPTGYLVQAGSAPGLSNLAVISTGSTAPAFAAVAPPGVYHVRVRALNGAGPGPASNEIVVVVP
jgi:hypothetical protein